MWYDILLLCLIVVFQNGPIAGASEIKYTNPNLEFTMLHVYNYEKLRDFKACAYERLLVQIYNFQIFTQSVKIFSLSLSSFFLPFQSLWTNYSLAINY